MTDPSMPEDRSLLAELRGATGLNVATCVQCGKCSAGCPMAEEMSFPPHQMLRLVQLDQRERLLDDGSFWLCLTCETCSTRCPNRVDPARLFDGLRELSGNTGGHARIRAFHQAFLDQICRYGRLYELGLALDYKVRSGALLDDLLLAPGMLRRGKLAFFPDGIDGREEVRRIFQACEKLENEEGS